MQVYTISKYISIIKEKEICVENKESISGHRCERTGMSAKCEIFMNCSKTFIGKKNKQIWIPKMECLKDHRCEITDIACKFKIFECQLKNSSALYIYVCTVQSYWYKYRKENMSSKQGIHKFSWMIKNKYGCQTHSTSAYYCWAQGLLADLFYNGNDNAITWILKDIITNHDVIM